MLLRSQSPSLSHSFSFDCICISKCRKTTNESNCILRVWLSHPLLPPHKWGHHQILWDLSLFFFNLYAVLQNFCTIYMRSHSRNCTIHFLVFLESFWRFIFPRFCVFFFSKCKYTAEPREKQIRNNDGNYHWNG